MQKTRAVLTIQVLAALDQVKLQHEGKISPPPIAISRNVRAAVDRARQQEADDASDLSDGLGGEEGIDDQLDSFLEDDDSDAEEDGTGIDLDEFFAHEKQLAMVPQQQQQRPARSRRR